MALNLYRRHGAECNSRHLPDTRTYETDELRRSSKKCFCPIYASGILGGKFRRKNTECIHWNDAKAVVTAWEAAENGDSAEPAGPSAAADAPPVERNAPKRFTIDEALRSYLAVRESNNIALPTVRKHRGFAKKLRAFAAARGYVMLDQFTVIDIDEFYSAWRLSARSKGNVLGMLRSFFRFCANRDWILKSPVSEDLKPPMGASNIANKVPFTDTEIERIIEACERLEPITWHNGESRGTWTGEDAKDFIWFLIYTGLRISDAAFFHVSQLRGNELRLRAKKNGGDVYTWLPDWLVERLTDRAGRFGPQPFVLGRSIRLETVTDLWRRRVNRVFALAGRFEERPTPHRFRHTFARILLARGVPVADVADLLGDDERTVRTHYARWVPERQARLTNILKEAFADKPKPNLVEMPLRAG